MKNNWAARALRTLTSILPVSKNRAGKCISCGACCKLPNACPFLKNSKCSIYKIRPLNCRKYPRTEKEHITSKTCGFRFK